MDSAKAVVCADSETSLALGLTRDGAPPPVPALAGHRRSATAMIWLSLLVALAVALVAAAAVVRLHDRADSRRQRQLLLAEVERFGHRLRLLDQSNIEGDPAGVVRRIEESVSALSRSAPGDAAAERVAEAAHDYLVARAEAATIEAAVGFDLFVEAASEAAIFYDAQAARALLFARQGSAVAIGVEGVLVAFLAFLIAQLGRRADARVHEERARSEAYYKALLQHCSDVVALLSPAGRLLYLSPPVERMLGGPPEKLLDRDVFSLIHPDDVDEARRRFRRVREQRPGAGELLELRLLDARRCWRWVEVSASNPGTAVPGIIINFREVTERRLLQEQLRFQALHDPLTLLANRYCLNERLEDVLSSREEGAEGGMALLYLDLDDFKQINDRFGHGTGDLLLVEIAERLLSVVRPHDLVARLGGDEFGILLDRIGREEAEAVAARVVEALRRAFTIGSQQHRVYASLGVAIGKAEDRPEDLLQRADQVMYLAKTNGKDRFCIGDDLPPAPPFPILVESGR